MPATYDPIATQTLGSNSASVTFSSIPSTYTDLVLVIKPINSTPTDLWLTFNTDTSSNYSSTWLWGNGSSAGSNRDTSAARIYLLWLATSASDGSAQYIAQIQNYSNTTTNKTVLVRGGRASAAVDAGIGMWRNTAAINQIVLSGTNVYQTGSTFTLYGIKAA
jgi:hypothetical protein